MVACFFASMYAARSMGICKLQLWPSFPFVISMPLKLQVPTCTGHGICRVVIVCAFFADSVWLLLGLVRHCSDYHLKSGHYIEGINDSLEAEMQADNRKRPGRYMMLQAVEAKADSQLPAGMRADRMQSSLTTARILKEKVGDMKWDDVCRTL